LHKGVSLRLNEESSELKMRKPIPLLVALLCCFGLLSCTTHKHPSYYDNVNYEAGEGQSAPRRSYEEIIAEQQEIMRRQKEELKRQEQELQDLRRQKYHNEYLRQRFAE